MNMLIRTMIRWEEDEREKQRRRRGEALYVGLYAAAAVEVVLSVVLAGPVALPYLLIVGLAIAALAVEAEHRSRKTALRELRKKSRRLS